MAKAEIRFEDFMMNVHPAIAGEIFALDSRLTEKGCVRKIEDAKSGPRATYTVGKRSVLNLVFRKSGLLARIYGENVAAYADIMDALPESMAKEAAKAPDCKRLTIAPDACSGSCPMGYDFTIRGQRLQKCRYGGMLFLANDSSLPFIKAILEREVDRRTA